MKDKISVSSTNLFWGTEQIEGRHKIEHPTENGNLRFLPPEAMKNPSICFFLVFFYFWEKAFSFVCVKMVLLYLGSRDIDSREGGI